MPQFCFKVIWHKLPSLIGSIDTAKEIQILHPYFLQSPCSSRNPNYFLLLLLAIAQTHKGRAKSSHHILPQRFAEVGVEVPHKVAI
jgi:hypothetical protein